MVMLWVLLQLLRQPGERLCYGYHASQERINVPVIPTTPRIFFQPLSARLAYTGFSEQCDTHWCHEQDDQQYNMNLRIVDAVHRLSQFMQPSNMRTLISAIKFPYL